MTLGQLKIMLDTLDPNNNIGDVTTVLNQLEAASRGLWLSDYIEVMFTTGGDESAVDRRVEEQRQIDQKFPY